MHVFGRGLARLRAVQCDGIICTAAAGTLDGLVVEQGRCKANHRGIIISGTPGRTRLQNSAITGSFKVGLTVVQGSDPVIVACRCVRRGRLF